ncbi:MAG: AarF/UbiB family protein [Chloroflexota bacterium]|nr:AarF/UbiB family protein [Chloroflexota bacterium]
MRINPVLWQISRIYRWFIISIRLVQVSFLFDKFLIRLLFRVFRNQVHKVTRSDTSQSESALGLVRELLEDMGPTYIKFGQMLSIRPELPSGLREEFQKLQERVPPFGYKKAKVIIERELRAPLDKVFSTFDEEPIAAASLCEVHRAILRKEQVEVAVKVQRPNLDSTVTVDLAVLDFIVHTLERLFPIVRGYAISQLLGVFSRAIRKEMDFKLEASSQTKAARNFRQRDKSLPDLGTIIIPRVYWRYTREKVLTMEFIHAIPFSALIEDAKTNKTNYHNKAITLSRIYAEMVIEHKFTHADPHPGNIYLSQDGNFVLFDFGMVDHIDDDVLNNIQSFLLGIFYFADPKMTVDALLELNIGRKDRINRAVLLDDIRTLFDKHIVVDDFSDSGNVKIKGIASLSQDVIGLASHFTGFRVPDSVCWLIKIVAYMDGLSRELRLPAFDMIQMFQPYLQRVAINRGIEHSGQHVSGTIQDED